MKVSLKVLMELQLRVSARAEQQPLFGDTAAAAVDGASGGQAFDKRPSLRFPSGPQRVFFFNRLRLLSAEAAVRCGGPAAIRVPRCNALHRRRSSEA